MATSYEDGGLLFNLKVFGVGIGTMIGVQVLSILAGSLFGLVTHWIVAIMAPFLMAFAVVDRFGKVMIGALILSCAASIFWSFISFSVILQLFTPRMYGISVAEAPLHPKAGIFVFIDGTVRDDMTGDAEDSWVFTEQSGKERGSNHRYRVAPLVHESWTKNDPVPAWVSCTDTVGDAGYLADRITGCMQGWKEPLHGGYKSDPDDREGLEAAIDRAVKAYDLTRNYAAPVLVWSSNPLVDQRRHARPGLFTIIGFHLVWLICVVVAAVKKK